MTDKEKDTTELLGCVALFLSLPLQIALRGFVLNVLWGWFITPIFGMSSPGVVACVGLSVTAAAFRGVNTDETEEGDAGEKCLRLIFWPLFSTLLSLALGWIVHLFM